MFLRRLLPAAIICLVAGATTLAADNAAKAALGKKDLSLQGLQFVLKDEMAVSKDIAAVSQYKAEWMSATRKFRSSERKIKQAKGVRESPELL